MSTTFFLIRLVNRGVGRGFDSWLVGQLLIPNNIEGEISLKEEGSAGYNMDIKSNYR